MIDIDIEVDANDAKRIDRLMWVLSTGLAGHAITAGRQYDASTMLGERVLPYLRSRVRQRFAQAGDDASGKWAPLRRQTEWFRRAQGFRGPGPINTRSGALRMFAQSFDIDSTGTTAQLTMPSRVAPGRLTTKLRHAQQGGVSSFGRPFPARPVAAINTTDQVVIERHVVNWIDDIFRQLA